MEGTQNSDQTAGLSPQELYQQKKIKAAALAALPGHPLHTLTRENLVLADLLLQAKKALAEKQNVTEALSKIRDLSIHYAKKGDLLYPHLKVKYGIAGPSDLMWTTDDDIRDDLAKLLKKPSDDDIWFTQAENILQRADKMIYQEANILFPMCALNFTEEEWMGIYQDSKDYGICFGVESDIWAEAEAHTAPESQSPKDEIVMPGGHLTVEQLTALLNTIPLEITFVDADNINRFFNEGPKVFKRPGMAIDREVFSCHPPKIEAMVRSIIDDFRNGRKDSIPIWMDKGGKSMLVTYMAVRDSEHNYVGTVEIVQDMEFAKKHFEKKNN